MSAPDIWTRTVNAAPYILHDRAGVVLDSFIDINDAMPAKRAAGPLAYLTLDGVRIARNPAPCRSVEPTYAGQRAAEWLR